MANCCLDELEAYGAEILNSLEQLLHPSCPKTLKFAPHDSRVLGVGWGACPGLSRFTSYMLMIYALSYVIGATKASRLDAKEDNKVKDKEIMKTVCAMKMQ